MNTLNTSDDSTANALADQLKTLKINTNTNKTNLDTLWEGEERILAVWPEAVISTSPKISWLQGCPVAPILGKSHS